MADAAVTMYAESLDIGQSVRFIMLCAIEFDGVCVSRTNDLGIDLIMQSTGIPMNESY